MDLKQPKQSEAIAEKECYREEKQILSGFMEVIDRWIEEKPDDKEGAFRFLSEKTFVRNIVLSSSRKISEARLKTFLDTDVLNLYDDNKSKVTHRTIERYLEGSLGKKYCFDFTTLKEYADRDIKMKALFAEISFPEHINDPELVEQVMEDMPYLLLRDLKNSAAYCLRNYWKKIRECFGQDKRKSAKKVILDTRDESIQSAYENVLLAVALFELFVREFLIERGEFLGAEWEEKERQDIPRLNKLKESMLQLAQVPREELWEKHTGQLFCMMEEMEEWFQKAERISLKVKHTEVFLVVMQEYLLELYADIMILMLVERGAYVTSEGMDQWFSCFSLDKVVTGINMDRNKRQFYRRAGEYMNVILEPWKRKITLEELEREIDGYFDEKNRNREERKEIRKRLAAPINEYMMKNNSLVME